MSASFQSTPSRGGRPDGKTLDCSGVIMFQSTPSRGGRPLDTVTNWTVTQGFNPRPHAEGDVLINCPQCGKYFKKIQYYQKFCSKECFLAHHTITLLCCNCGKSFVIGLSEYKGRLRNRKSSGFYCSKICWGKYFGAFYGLHSEYQNGKAKDNGR